MFPIVLNKVQLGIVLESMRTCIFFNKERIRQERLGLNCQETIRNIELNNEYLENLIKCIQNQIDDNQRLKDLQGTCETLKYPWNDGINWRAYPMVDDKEW